MASGSRDSGAVYWSQGWSGSLRHLYVQQGAGGGHGLAGRGDGGKAFETGRDFAAWLGLTPRESSTGGKQRLGRIRQAMLSSGQPFRPEAAAA